jgi:hypothetical protein
MKKQIVEIRILPPFAIGRLGSSEDPMDNFKLEIKDPIGFREIWADDTLIVNRTGEVTCKRPPFEVKFRDAADNIRPVSPFLEVWVRFKGSADLELLTTQILSDNKLSPADLKWRVHVANIKAYRRTGDPNDRIDAKMGPFSDHKRRGLKGTSNNFITGKFLPLGFVQYIKPSKDFPEIRFRFTPAGGKVYGPPLDSGERDPNTADAVYDPNKGKWKGYADPWNVKTDPIGVRKATNPAQIYAGKSIDKGNTLSSYGYLDDECDGIVEVEMSVGGEKLSAYGRVSAGPPAFAPDSFPVRTVYDELEQALNGPDFDGPLTDEDLADVIDIVRRALETVRLMNTAQMNMASIQRGVGMARMDTLDVARALEPIVDQAVSDSLAIRSRHERVLLALESGSLAWFARVLRDYDKIGELGNEERRKMPALMRNADGRHLALTRRQVSKVKAAAQYYLDTIKNDD